MKNSKKIFGNAGQSTTEVKKPQKHDANLQKNSTLYFQIGLILCLLGTYALFEMQFQDKKIVIDTVTIDDVAIIDVPPTYRLEEIQPEESEPEVNRSTELKDTYEEVKDDQELIETKIVTPEERKPENQPAEVDDIVVVEAPEDPVIVDFISVEKVPVYPGCEKYDTNGERKKCMSQKISKLVSKKFNTDIGSEYGLSGRQRISTQFTIDKNGDVVDVKIRGPHHALEKEANRVIHKIPKMEPGLQRNVPVGVMYTLPIVFDVRN